MLATGKCCRVRRSEGTILTNEKATYRMGKNMGPWCDLQGLNFQNTNSLYNSTTEKPPNQKTGRRLRHFSKEDTFLDAQQARDSAHHCYLSETHKSKQQWGSTSHLPEWPSLKSIQIINVQKREPSHTVFGNINCAATVENSIEVPQKTKNRIPIRPSNPTPGHISR